jgi:hypothetical protein
LRVSSSRNSEEAYLRLAAFASSGERPLARRPECAKAMTFTGAFSGVQ